MDKEAVSLHRDKKRLDLHVFEVLWSCFKWAFWGFRLQNIVYSGFHSALLLFFPPCQGSVFSISNRGVQNKTLPSLTYTRDGDEPMFRLWLC